MCERVCHPSREQKGAAKGVKLINKVPQLKHCVLKGQTQILQTVCLYQSGVLIKHYGNI